MLKISELFIYPIKSLGGFSVSESIVTDRGLKHDRRWMLVDENNCFLTQRRFPKMALLQVNLTTDGLRVVHKLTQQAVCISFERQTTETAIAQIWDDACQVNFISSAADEYFSTMLSGKCRLVYMPDATKRLVEKDFAFNNEVTNLSDGYPILMLGQASLDDLNTRLKDVVPIDRFRPNIVFTGGEPFEEDTIAQFTINDLQFCGVKPCGRCLVTTIDQQNGLRGREPLATMATYRVKDGKVRFGQNVLVQGLGLMRVGDEIKIVKKTTSIHS